MTEPTNPTPDPDAPTEPTDPAPEATPKGKRTPFDAPADAKGSDRKALYDRTEGRFVTGPGEPGKGAPSFDRVKGHTYATVKV